MGLALNFACYTYWEPDQERLRRVDEQTGSHSLHEMLQREAGYLGSISRSNPTGFRRRWRLAICAVKPARQISLDFFFQMLYSTSGGF